jgi:hypothetical protein
MNKLLIIFVPPVGTTVGLVEKEATGVATGARPVRLGRPGPGHRDSDFQQGTQCALSGGFSYLLCEGFDNVRVLK